MVEKKQFDTLNGQEVPLYVLSDGPMEVELLPFGAAIRAIRVPDRDGKIVDVALGYDDVASYRDLSACVGGTLGRCANRIGGAKFTLNGQEYKLAANSGPNSIHGGVIGWHKRLWKTAVLSEKAVAFSLESPDGEEGYPGNVTARVKYTLEKGTLGISYEVRTDKDTVVNMTNHCYFNLAGHDGGVVADHEIRVQADAYTPTDENNVPTGEIAGVEGTVLDLRETRVLGELLGDASLQATLGLDHNMIVRTPGGKDPIAELYCPRTGIALEVRSTQEGMQVYTAGWLGERTGKNGVFYGPTHAVCFESQHFPNAINCPGFPSPVLKAGEVFRAETSWKFFTK